MPPQHRALLGLGSNIGNPVEQLARAVAMLRQAMELDAISSVYRSEPVGVLDQPMFFNLVVAGRARMTAGELLAATRRIEAALGRTRSARFGPRLIDIDILAIDDLLIDSPQLTVPHPRLHERPFVLVPIAEIAPEWRHPTLHRTAAELNESARTAGWIELVGPLPAASAPDLS